MDTFENHQNQPLEELRIKYTNSGENIYDESIPALDQRWCNKDYKFALYLTPPSKSADGEFIMGAKEDWIERMNLFIDDLSLLLSLDYHRFWSEVVFNNLSLSGMNSFLQHATPFYLKDKIVQDKDILKLLRKGQKLVFLLFLRLTTEKESEKRWMKSTTLGSILYNNFIFSLPQLMEISLIYANDNFKEVFDLVNKIIDIQSKYIGDIEKSTSFICEVFSKLETQVLSASELSEEPTVIANNTDLITPVEVVNSILLVLDISYSVATFLKVCPKAAKIYHCNQMEARIASFYGNTIPVLSRHLDDHFSRADCHDQYVDYQHKLKLCRHQLILAVHECLTSSLSCILEERDYLSEEELKNKVDSYLNTISDCLSSDHLFVRDFNSAFPIDRELKILAEVYPKLDTLKRDFILESVKSLYDLPTKPKNTLKNNKLRQNEPSTSIQAWNEELSQPFEAQSSSHKISGVELDSLISAVKDVLPHLGDGFIAKCLEHFKFVSTDVINAVLESTLPESLASLDFEMPIIPPESNEGSPKLPERVNVYDNDEFDVMIHDTVDTSRIHKGKRPGKHKNMFDMLNDKTDVNNLRDMYSKLSLVEYMENVDEYEDEYDDTYDDIDTAVGNEGNTEVEERRAFVTPRILQQQQQIKEYPAKFEEDDEIDEGDSKHKADMFIENPADVRERYEQRRQDQRRGFGGRSRAGFPRSNVVGKPKGQGQDKDVIRSREFKGTNKASRGNHNRRTMAAKKRHQGMVPT